MGNSTSFKPGESGNPNGRPLKDESITNIIKKYLAEISKGGNGKTNKELMIQEAFLLAMKGDMNAIKYLTNYHDGMPLQKMDIQGSISQNPILEAISDIKNNNTGTNDVEPKTE